MNYIILLLFIQLIVLFLTDVSGQITGPDRPISGIINNIIITILGNYF